MVGAVKTPLSSLRLPSKLFVTVPAYMLKSVTFRAVGDCAEAVPGLLPPRYTVHWLSKLPAVNGRK